VKAVIRHLPLNNLLKTFLTDWWVWVLT
jgi:hypothetical protein